MSSRRGQENDIRHRWLGPPAEAQEIAGPRATTALGELERLRDAAQRAEGEKIRTRLAMCEAQASSYIENIFDDTTEPGSHSNRLFQAMGPALASTDSREVLKWHRTLMARHPDPRMRPGRYRDSGVIIGDWLPPHHSELFWRMEQFHHWMNGAEDPLMRAIWGHRYFETIHPFADGNGRTGRLLILQALQAPVAISRHIWWDRPVYYRLLSSGTWAEWRDWMLETIIDAARLSAQDVRGPADARTDLEAITAMNRAPWERSSEGQDSIASAGEMSDSSPKELP